MQSLSRVTPQRAEQLSSKSLVGLETQSRGSLKLLLKSFQNKCFWSVLFSCFACFINTFCPNIVNKLWMALHLSLVFVSECFYIDITHTHRAHLNVPLNNSNVSLFEY